jgi:vitamin B12 transporter
MKFFGMRGLMSLFGALHFLISVPCAYAQRELEPVVVTATRQAMKASDVLSDVTTISSEEIRNAGAVSLAELLGRQRGVEFTQYGGPGGTSEVFIRGSNANHVLLLVDGVRVGSATLGTPTWEFIPLEMIDHIEILRGPVSSLYGSDAIGGVVQIFTKRGEGPARPFFEIGMGSQNTTVATAGISGGQEGWRYNFMVSDKKSDSINATSSMKRGAANSFYYADLDGYQNSSSSGGLSYSPVNGQEYGFNYLYSDGVSKWDNEYTPLGNYSYKKTISSFNVYGRYSFSDIWTTTVRFGQSLDDNRSLKNEALSSAYKTTQTHYQIQNDIRLPLGMALLALERVDQQVVTTDNYSFNERAINSALAGWTGGFGSHRLQANIRQDSNTQYGLQSTGALSYGYQWSSNWRSSVSWGTAFKSPTFNDLYYPNDGGQVGNPSIKPENSTNREASVHYETDAQQSSATFYENDVTNLIQWAANNSGLWTPSNAANAKLRGWTFAHKQEFGNYQVVGSLDFQDPYDQTLNKTLIYRAREIAKLGLSRSMGKLNIGVELQSSGKRFVDADNTVELAGYTLINLRAQYKLNKEWTFFARANNIFDKTYELREGYATPGSNLFAGIRYTPK